MILSILIATLEKRKKRLQGLLNNLYSQIQELQTKEVEILINKDNGQKPTGTKRNELLQKAKGKYIVFIDDDDEVPVYYIREILNASKTNCDSMAINGTLISKNGIVYTWDIRQANPYVQRGNHFLRYPNHITPIKREHAIKIRFRPITIGEDYHWATEIKNRRLLKTEHIITRPMYVYKPNK